MQRCAEATGRLSGHGDRVGIDCPDAVDGSTDQLVGAGREVVHPLRPLLRIGVGVATLGPLDRLIPAGIETAVEVEGVEEGDADAGVFGRSQQCVAHLIRIVVGRAVRLMVHVVELTHCRLAGQHHLCEHRSSEAMIGVGIEAGRSGVHHVAPRPERATIGLGPGAQHAVKGMAVGVRQSGNRQPGEARGISRWCGVGVDGGEATVAGGDRDPAMDGTVDCCVFAPPTGHDPTRSTKAVIRSTNASR